MSRDSEWNTMDWRLMPREERFFDLFGRHAEAVVAGAIALRAMLEGKKGESSSV